MPIPEGHYTDNCSIFSFGETQNTPREYGEAEISFFGV